jgi:putative glutamine amidotransferase
MARKPLIGLNTDFVSAVGDRPAYSVASAGYFDAIARAGGNPILLPPVCHDDDDLDGLLSHLQGVVLVGGRDLDPRNDGFMLHPSIRLMDERREQFDRRLAQVLCERRVPVFGIGAGMQLLNLTMGGSLYLHIPEDLPRALPHRDPQDTAHRHGLEVAQGTDSIMERVFGDGEVRVNSLHHMAVDEVAPGFAVTARCPDGVVEAIESQIEGWVALGTQFHPEADSASALDQRIFEEFLEAATRVSYAPVRMVA